MVVLFLLAFVFIMSSRDLTGSYVEKRRMGLSFKDQVWAWVAQTTTAPCVKELNMRRK